MNVFNWQHDPDTATDPEDLLFGVDRKRVTRGQ